LEGLRVVVLTVAPEDVARMVEVPDLFAYEDPGAGRVDAGSEDLTGLDTIGVREDIGGGGLGVAGRRHTVREVGEVHPDLRVVGPPGGPHMRVGIYVAGDDSLAGDVDYLCALRHGDLAPAPDGGDAVVADHDIRILDDLVAAHGDGACAP